MFSMYLHRQLYQKIYNKQRIYNKKYLTHIHSRIHFDIVILLPFFYIVKP